jgi:predicted acylesterase/phospholipase RssA
MTLVVLGAPARCQIPSAVADPKRPKIALVLSGGAAYSLAEFGALEWLEEHRIPVDCMVGTSGGAIVGGWYSTGLELLTDDELSHPLRHDSPADMKLHGVVDLLSHLDLDPIFRPFASYALVDVDGKALQTAYPFGPIAGIRDGRFTFTDGVVPGEELERFLDRIAERTPKEMLYASGETAPFDRLPTPFRAVASQPHGYDVHRWETIVLGGRPSLPRLPNYPVSLQDSIRASLAIPYVFTPRYLPPVGTNRGGPQYGLVDGGLRDNYPTDIACDTFNPDVLIGLHIDVDLTPLNAFYRLTGHQPGPIADLQKSSNSFKYGSSQKRRPLAFSVPMIEDQARPDQFDDYRHLSFLGYRSMEEFAASAKGRQILSLTVSSAAYAQYRQARRAKIRSLPELMLSRAEIGRAAELTSTLGLGSTRVDTGGPGPIFQPLSRQIGPTQFFADVGGSAATGDLATGYLDLAMKSYSFGSKFSDLDATLQLGTSSLAKLEYRYARQADSWFVKPFLSAESQPFSEFSGGRRVYTEQVGDQKGGLQIGALLGSAAKVSATAEAGNLSLNGNRHFLQQTARFDFNDQNSELFPTQGLLADAFARDLMLDPGLRSLNQAEVSGEFRAAASSNWTAILKAELATSFGARPIEELDFSLGGFGSLEGFPDGWAETPSYQLASFTVAKRIQKIPFFLGNSQWLTGFEAAQASGHTYRDLFTGLLISTRATKFYSAIAVSDHFRPRLLLGFGNHPFAAPTLLGN